jgi:hypothetical protein
MYARGSRTLRRIARMEVLADRVFRERQLGEAAWDKFHRDCSRVAISNLALLVLYGAPQVEEPLTAAWTRSLKTLHSEFPNFADNGCATPFAYRCAPLVTCDFRKFILPRLPGADDNAKVSRVLADCPKWLLWHANADKSAEYLDLPVPDLRSMRRFARGRWYFRILPSGSFERRKWSVDKTKKSAPNPGDDQSPVPTRHEMSRAFRVQAGRNLLADYFQKRVAEGKEIVPDNPWYPFPDLFEDVVAHPDEFSISTAGNDDPEEP